jgi:ATP-dependent Clp protease ATP-binding subunit ClpC
MDADPLERVGTAVEVAEELGSLGDRLVTFFVSAAREAGCSWSQIGGRLGVSKQAAQQGFVAPPKRRFGRRRPPPPQAAPFAGYGGRARQVVMLAQDEARALRHDYVGTEHLLLALLREGGGTAARALVRLGVTADLVRAQVEDIVGRGTAGAAGEAPLTPRTKKVLELALREARHLGAERVGTEHVLLALVREGEGLAAQILVRLGADLASVRQAVTDLLAG